MNQKVKVSPHVCGMLKEYHVLTQRIGKFNYYLNNCPSTKELHEQELQLAAMRLYAYHLAKRIELNGTDPEKTDVNELFRHDGYISSDAAILQRFFRQNSNEVLTVLTDLKELCGDAQFYLNTAVGKVIFDTNTDEKQGEMDMESYKAAEDEKREFVGDGFIKCYADFQDFKEGETYWLEYVGNDNYNVRSDNLLSKTYHITPCQLYTIFKKMTWLEKQDEKPCEEQEAPAIKSCPGIKFRVGDTVVCHDEKDRYFGTKNRIAAVYPEHGVYVCEDFQVILIQDQESYGLWEPIEKQT